MFNFTLRSSLIYAFVLVLFLFHAFADAGLVRGIGRGGVTVSFGSLDLLVPVNQINEFGLLNWSYFDNMPEIDKVGIIPPGYPMVQGVPDDCFVPLDGTEEFEDDPCYWQFGVNEPVLNITGSTVSHFTSAMQNISWQIFESGADVFNSIPVVEFDNSHTTVGPEPLGGISPLARELQFEAAMPDNLAPGEYQILLTMEQLAPDGYVFYSADTVNDGQACFGEPGNILCSRMGSVRGTTFSQVAIERLVVVNEPGKLWILGSLLFFIAMRYRKTSTK